MQCISQGSVSIVQFAEQQEGCEQSLKVLSDAQYIVKKFCRNSKDIESEKFSRILKGNRTYRKNYRAGQDRYFTKGMCKLPRSSSAFIISRNRFRIGEILGNRYATDIDYENHLIYVNFREDNENDARAKNAEFRKAKVSDATFEILKFYLEEYKDLIFQQEYLLVNVSGKYAGKPMQDSGVRSLMERLEKKTGIKCDTNICCDIISQIPGERQGWKLELISQALGHRHIEQL